LMLVAGGALHKERRDDRGGSTDRGSDKDRADSPPSRCSLPASIEFEPGSSSVLLKLVLHGGEVVELLRLRSVGLVPLDHAVELAALDFHVQLEARYRRIVGREEHKLVRTKVAYERIV
jgi:hypothetical protein